MKNKTTYIDAGVQDTGRPKERPSKTNWKLELLKKSLLILQFFTPRKVALMIWAQFTKPVAVRFKNNQLELMERAATGSMTYKGLEIITYRWGSNGPKILLSHGWNSKIADFRRMIDQLVAHGFVVEGVDMPAHGRSEGTRSALPEVRDILKAHWVKNGPYHAVVGYSFGGIAAGMVQSELPDQLQTKNLFILAAPPYVRYFFEDIVKKELHLSDKIYQIFCGLVEEVYGESVDYFDLRTKQNELKNTDIHLVYDEDDQTVPFDKGKEMRAVFPDSYWVHTKGIGHYRIIAQQEVIDYLLNVLSTHPKDHINVPEKTH